MKIKILVFLIILLVFIAAGASFFLDKNFQPSIWFRQTYTKIDLQDKKISDNTKPFNIDITYPQINGLDDFNQKAKAIVDKEIAEFKINSLANDEVVKRVDPENYATYPRQYDLIISYAAGQIDDEIASTIFNIYNFEGGAHGASYFVPLNYDTKLKREIKLSDIFPDQQDLQKISDFCIADLTKQITEKMGDTEGSWIQDGAGPNEENFSNFLINKDGITFYFEQYQIAPGAAGDFKVVYPK